MSAQDDVEKVLRSLHVMLSKGEAVDGDATKVIIEKQKMLDLLSELNRGMYAIMDQYELTTTSRDKAEREFQKQADEIIRGASRKAEDIYAASVMYTDEALSSVQEIMREANASVQKIFAQMDEKLKEREQAVRTNQLELKGSLQDLVDSDKYLRLIEERNREIAKQKAEGSAKSAGRDSSIYANRQTEVRVNTEYLRKLGLGDADAAADALAEEKLAAEEPKPEASASRDKEDTGEKKPVTDLKGVWKNLTLGRR